MRSEWFLLILIQFVHESYTWNDSKDNMLPFFLDFEKCHNEICFKDAHNLLSSINSSMDPCVDFYEFACGSWVLKNKKPSSESIWTQWESVILKVEEQVQQILENNSTKSKFKSLNIARQMYQTCINIENEESQNMIKLIKLLDEFGGWPLIETNRSKNDFWLSTVTNINSKFNIHPLIKFHVSLNLYNTSEYILYIDHPTFGFPQWMLTNSLTYKTQLKAYIQWIMNTALEMAINNHINISHIDIKHQIIDIIKFEIELASLVTINDGHNITSMYKKITIDQLQLWTDLILAQSNKNIVWIDIINQLLSNYNMSVKKEDNIIVNDIYYILKVIELTEKTSSKIVANYIGWCIVKYFTKDTSEKLQIFSLQIDKLLLGIEENISRKRHCAILTNKQMNLAISYEYINMFINDSIKQNVEDMMENTKSILISTLKTLTWMDDITKKNALEKAQAITYLVANPDCVKNETFIDNYYKELEATNNHIQNIINWNKFTRQHEFLQLQSSVHSKKWYISVTDVNAYYSILENSIIIPAGLLQFPFYDAKRVRALNYGALGTILAHEFSHAFDNTGRQADKNGNIRQWWSSKSLTEYTKIIHCLQEHFNKYIIEMLQSTFYQDLEINDLIQKTQDENIADIIGLKLAYEAYNNKAQNSKDIKLPLLENFTSEQLFFISFANQWCELPNTEQLLTEIMEGEHTPNKIRVLGVLSNSEEFSKAFKCEINSPMNPNKKCKLW